MFPDRGELSCFDCRARAFVPVPSRATVLWWWLTHQGTLQRIRFGLSLDRFGRVWDRYAPRVLWALLAVFVVQLLFGEAIEGAIHRALWQLSNRHWWPRSAAAQRADAAKLDRDCPAYAFDEDCPAGWRAVTDAELKKLQADGWRQEWWSVMNAYAAAIAARTGEPAFKPRAPRALCVAADYYPLSSSSRLSPLHCCPAQTIDPFNGIDGYGPSASVGDFCYW